eukprot:TRINITY_DN3754_c0_g1_i1.p1 TRINITY_DN3754_c0_g1~~TRINITY_DN3754_c0_g1_i1.p1  ORF type:complete len:979 (-),score=200.80 TRINITY_DN3754_c0_g1_i1:180-3116(-)
MDSLRMVSSRFEEMLALLAAQHEQDVSLLRRKLVEMQEQLHALGHSLDDDSNLQGMIGSQDLFNRAMTIHNQQQTVALADTVAPVARPRRKSLQGMTMAIGAASKSDGHACEDSRRKRKSLQGMTAVAIGAASQSDGSDRHACEDSRSKADDKKTAGLPSAVVEEAPVCMPGLEKKAAHLPSAVVEEAPCIPALEGPDKVQDCVAPPREPEPAGFAVQSNSENNSSKASDDEADTLEVPPPIPGKSDPPAKPEHHFRFRSGIDSLEDVPRAAAGEHRPRRSSRDGLGKSAVDEVSTQQHRIIRKSQILSNARMSLKAPHSPDDGRRAARQSVLASRDAEKEKEPEEDEEEDPKKLEEFQKGYMSKRRVALPFDVNGDTADEQTGEPKYQRHELLAPWRVPQAFLKAASIKQLRGQSQKRMTAGGEAIMYAEAEDGRCKRAFAQIKNVLGGDPNSSRHFWWDVVSLWLFILDLVLVPLLVSFQLLGAGVEVLWCFTTLFWTFDFTRAFFVGYRVRGEVVLDTRMVVIHYLKTYCFLDISICMVDWLWLAGASSHASLRLSRLLRLRKIMPVVRVIEERSESDTVTITLRISKHLVTILIMCHWIACIWWSLGQSTTPSWISDLPDWYEQSFVENYALSLHWALTQFTPATATPATPRSLLERIFNIVTILAALIVFSVSFSGITGALADMRSNTSAKARQYWILRKYLSKSGVPREIAVRVQENFNYSWGVRNSPMLENNVQALELLSPTLKEELRMATFMPAMGHHPLMCIFHKAAVLTMQSLCAKAMTPLLLTGGDTVFHPGQVARSMFFVRNGSAMYEIILDTEAESGSEEEEDQYKDFDEDSSSSSTEDSSIEGTLHTERLVARDWIGEPVLWTVWVHLGGFQATQQCELVALDSEQFQESLRLSAPCQAEACLYARRYVDELNEADTNTYTDAFKCEELHQSRLLPDVQLGVGKEPKRLMRRGTQMFGVTATAR